MENYSIQTCSRCGSYLIPQIRYQYGTAWTEYYCVTCGKQNSVPQLIYSTTVDHYDWTDYMASNTTKKQKKFKSRLIKGNEEHE